DEVGGTEPTRIVWDTKSVERLLNIVHTANVVLLRLLVRGKHIDLVNVSGVRNLRALETKVEHTLTSSLFSLALLDLCRNETEMLFPVVKEYEIGYICGVDVDEPHSEIVLFLCDFSHFCSPVLCGCCVVLCCVVLITV